jgi:hypothetical protein
MEWLDQWRTTLASRPNLPTIAQGASLFVQPVGSGEAGDLADNRSQLRKWIQQCADADLKTKTDLSRLQTLLWLPDDICDPTFDLIAKTRSEDTDLILRKDSPNSLAEWIGSRFQSTKTNQKVPVLTLEEVDIDGAGRLRDALHSTFHRIVGEVVHPQPELWRFAGEQLVEQIRGMDADFAIIAVHDLNTGVARQQREARNQLEQKLGPISTEVQAAIRASGRKDLRLFWTALLVQKAELLPWVKYPSPSQFEKWCLLPFARTADDDKDTPQIVSPKTAALRVFRSYLRDWFNQVVVS